MGNLLAKAIGTEREPPTLPVEILLEIVARADPAALIRFAASSKHLRRQITDPAFLSHADADAGFVPSLFLGLFRQHADGEPYRFVPVSPSTKLALQLTPPPPTDDAADDLFDSYVPVASRAGLILLRRRRDDLIELCVCSPVTGRYAFLPAMALEDDFLHVLVPGDDNHTGHSFRLLVVNEACQTITFSSETGSWGPVTDTPEVLPNHKILQPAPVVLQGVAHWLCHERQSGHYQVLAIRLGDGQAAAIGEVPELCLRRRRTGPCLPLKLKDLLLVSTDGRQLGLLVAEVVVISLWTLSEDSKSWGARRVVVNRISMLQSVELHFDLIACGVYIDLEWFGEASGAVVLRVDGAGILVLNLRTNQIAQLDGRGERRVPASFRFCPYEVDLVSLIAGLKPFPDLDS